MPVKVTVGYLPMVTSLTHFVAESQGLYSKYGLDVTGVRINTSNLIAQELVTGHINVGIELAINPLVNALTRSPGTAAVFSVSQIRVEGGFDGVVVRGDSPLQDLRSLSGKKVGVFPGSTATAFFGRVFRELHPDLPLPEFLQIPPALHLQELEMGRIDALHAYEPVLTVGLKTKGFRQIGPSIYGTDFPSSPIGVAAINTAWTRQNPEAARAIVAALDDAVKFVRTHPEEARKIMAAAVQLEPEIARAMNIMPMSLSSEIEAVRLREFLVHLHGLGEIEAVPEVGSLLRMP